MKPKSTLRSYLALAGSTLLAISYSHAANVTWDITPGNVGAGDSAVTGGLGAWNTTNGFWTTDAGVNNIAWVNANNDTAIFGGTAGTVTLGTGITVGGLQFDTTPYIVTGNTLTFGAASNIVTNADATISSILAGSAAITKTGTGTLTLNNTGSTYSGRLTIQNGTLSIAAINNVSANGNLGNSALSVILGGSGGQTGTLKYTAASGSTTKAFTLATGGTGVFDVTTALTIDFTGNSGIYGGGNLTKAGLGTLTFFVPDGSNGVVPEPQYTGVTQFAASGGRIKFSTNGFNNGDEVTLFNSAFDTTNTTASVGLDITGATNPWFGGLLGNVALGTAINVGYGSAASVNLNVRGGDSHSYSGVIANGAANMPLTKQGNGTQTLTNANTYSGATTVRDGTLVLGGALGSALNSAFTVRGGTLLLDNTAALANRLNDATALSLGSLTLKANVGGGTQSETAGATTFAVGGKVTVDLNGGTDQTTLAMGAVTRSVGAAIDFVGTGGTLGSGANSPNATSTGAWGGTQNGILPWATVGGTAWGEDNAGSIRAYSGTFTTLAAATNTTQAQQTGTATLGGALNTNSLNVISDGTTNILALGGNTISFGSTNVAGTLGAILKSGSNAYTISGGTIRVGTAGAGTELITHVDGGDLTISANLNTAIVNLAKGGTGNLILSGTRAVTMNGAISIAGGQLEFQGLSTSLTGVISGAGGLTANLNAGQILSINNNSNSYSGPTIVKGGIMRIGTAWNAYGFPGGTSRTGLSNLQINNAIVSTPYANTMYLGTEAGQFQITGGTAGFSASEGLNFRVNSRFVYEIVWGASGEGAATGYFNPSVFVLGDQTSSLGTIAWDSGFDLNGATRTISNTSAAYASTISGTIRNSNGTAGLTKTGAGALILSGVNTYNGPTTVNQGTLIATAATALPGYNSAGGVVFNGGTVTAPLGAGWTTAQVDTLLSNATKTSGVFGIDTTNGSLAQWTAFSAGNFGSLGLTKAGSNTLILNQTNTYTGGTTISGGTLIFQKLVSMPASGVVAVQTGATLGIGLGGVGEWTTGVSGEGTLGGLLAGLGGQVGGTVSYTGNVGLDLVTTGTQSYGVLANVGTSLALTKSGVGSLTLTGTNTYTGATSLNGGTLILDSAATDTTKLADAAALNLNGGTLNLKGGTHLELVSATNLNAGHTAITRNGGTAKLRMNALNRAAGGTISFADATIADTDRVNTNGILGGYATLGNDWATSAASGTDIAVTALVSYTGALPSSAGGALTDNDTLTGSQTQTGAVLANTVKIANSANSQTLDLSTFNLQITSTGATTLGGILYAGGSDNLYSITGTGRIVSSTANNELIFAVNTGTLTVSAFVGLLNASSPVTKFGAGTLVLSAANSYTGATRVNEGTLAWGANNVFAVTPFSIGSATLDASTFDDTVGTLDVTANATINLGTGANLAFAASNAVDWTGGTLNLTGTLDFSGTATSSLRFGTSAAGLTATQLASISSAGWTNFALNASGYLTATVDGGGSPEIAVEQPALTNIANGGSKSFGTVTLGSNTSLQFTIRNTGTANLNLTGSPLVSVTGTNAADFTVTATPTTPVTSGGGTTTFTVQFAPLGTTGGSRNAVLTIANNDSDEGTFTINVSGTAQTQYDAWSGGALFDADTNGDGVKNGVAFLLGASGPNAAVTLPTVTESGGNLTLNFTCLNAASRGGAALSVQHSSDLGISDPWTTAAVPETTPGSPVSGVTFTVTPGSPTNAVQATISSTQAAAGKLFGRLNAVNTP